jgi:hypothetical protein
VFERALRNDQRFTFVPFILDSTKPQTRQSVTSFGVTHHIFSMFFGDKCSIVEEDSDDDEECCASPVLSSRLHSRHDIDRTNLTNSYTETLQSNPPILATEPTNDTPDDECMLPSPSTPKLNAQAPIIVPEPAQLSDEHDEHMSDAGHAAESDKTLQGQATETEAAEAERQRLAQPQEEEAERQRLAQQEEEAERQRLAQEKETERQRLAQQQEERQRKQRVRNFRRSSRNLKIINLRNILIAWMRNMPCSQIPMITCCEMNTMNICQMQDTQQKQTKRCMAKRQKPRRRGQREYV